LALRELCIDTSTDDDLGSLESDTCWFHTLSLNCTNLVALSLDAQFSASARDQLELVLLGTRLGRLTLSRLLDDTLDDWGLALILAQESMITLELDRPTTETTFEVLEQQCNGLHALKKLQAMKVSIDVSHEEVFASLPSVTPSLAVLHATLHHTGEISPWCPTPAMFNAVGKLRRLSHLDMILHCHHPFGLQNYAAITSADLLALLECPLKTLNISAYKSEQEYMLGLQQVSGTELVYLLTKMQSLSSLQLSIGCDEITCDTQQKETICQLFKDLHLSNLLVGTFTDVDYVDPDGWL
jgi:hypothetical protein